MNVRKIGKAPKRPLKTRQETHSKWMILFSFQANYGHWLLVMDVKRIVIVICFLTDPNCLRSIS